mmetsp:Transcript_12054/g.30713  ORF Transcript_12054/g.30713 Transcript_12054/m.30713 type:complete len:205 (-) Transcript_12054:208-822(-)
MNFLQMGRISLESVAENIITCLSCGVSLKISCTSERMSRASSILSHSSRTKWRTPSSFSEPSLPRALTLPGVPTTMLGGLFLSASRWVLMFTPPKKVAILTSGRYALNRSNSWVIWNASSRVWHMTMAPTSPSLGSSCWSTARTKTAVLPIPDLAWQITSMPRMAWGMHSCWTSEGCSKPQSTIALRSSGLSRKSLNPVLWIVT